jgi:hypothetical protein
MFGMGTVLPSLSLCRRACIAWTVPDAILGKGRGGSCCTTMASCHWRYASNCLLDIILVDILSLGYSHCCICKVVFYLTVV